MKIICEIFHFYIKYGYLNNHSDFLLFFWNSFKNQISTENISLLPVMGKIWKIFFILSTLFRSLQVWLIEYPY